MELVDIVLAQLVPMLGRMFEQLFQFFAFCYYTHVLNVLVSIQLAVRKSINVSI
jgi:hypothetical protein